MTAHTKLAILLSGALLFACSDNDHNDDMGTTARTPTTPVPIDGGTAFVDGGVGTSDAAVQLEIDIQTKNLRFDPDTIRASPGEQLLVVLHNTGLIEHNIEFDFGNGRLQRLPKNVGRDETGSMIVRVPDVGRYEFYCPVDGHRAAGMTGTLIVE